MALPALQHRVPLSRRGRRATAIAYHRILVPLARREGSEEAMAIACQLAADRRASVTAVSVLEVPAELPLDAHMLEEEAATKHVLATAAAIADLHGVKAETRVLRARAAGEEIVAEANRTRAEIVVVAAVRKQHASPSAPVFGRTVDFVLKHAACRVMVAAPNPR